MVGCELCGSLHKLLRCSKCQNSYCQSHQTSHWQTHEHILDSFSSAPVQSGWSVESSNPSLDSSSFQLDCGSSAGHQQPGYVLTSTDRLSQSEATSARSWPTGIHSEYEQHWGAAAGDSTVGVHFTGLVTDQSSVQGDFLVTPPPYLHCNLKLVGHSRMPATAANSLWMQTMCQYVIRDMDKYGICVIDNFAGQTLGNAILEEVIAMYDNGQFIDGEVVSKPTGNASKTIRGDKIVWVNGNEPVCKNIGNLIKLVDTIVATSNKMRGNGKLGEYNISDRTSAMVACYPGGGTQYVKHVDNPNNDGRCITCIYYLNKDWDVKRDGGLLRIFPRGWTMSVADIDPMFDRILLFWSDRRNPHEVQPALRTRYAITLWYYDKTEKEAAWRQQQQQQGSAGVFVGHPLDTLKLKGFFRGMTFPLVSNGVVNSVFFGVYGHTCHFLGERNYGKATKDSRPQYAVIYFAGCLAGFVQLGIVVPFEVVKVKLQSQSQGAVGKTNSYRGSIHCLDQLWRNDRFRGCYQGFWIQTYRDVPAYGIYVLMYEWILYKLSNNGEYEMLNAGIAGGLAGAISWASIIPLDVLKSRLQADSLASPKYNGIVDCFRKSYAEGGTRVFLKGFGLATARAFPTNVVILTVYSWALTFLNSIFK